MAPTPQRRWVRWPPSSPSGLSPGLSSTWRLHASSATTTRSRHEPCWPPLPAPWVSTWCMSHAPSSLPPLAPHSPGLPSCVHLVSQAPSPSRPFCPFVSSLPIPSAASSYSLSPLPTPSPTYIPCPPPAALPLSPALVTQSQISQIPVLPCPTPALNPCTVAVLSLLSPGCALSPTPGRVSGASRSLPGTEPALLSAAWPTSCTRPPPSTATGATSSWRAREAACPATLPCLAAPASVQPLSTWWVTCCRALVSWWPPPSSTSRCVVPTWAGLLSSTEPCGALGPRGSQPSLLALPARSLTQPLFLAAPVQDRRPHQYPLLLGLCPWLHTHYPQGRLQSPHGR